jgi:DNA (cytosine-5)-methyltransferase 1
MASSKIVDLFAGAGGFSLGAQAAGFSPSLAIDLDPDLTSSHKTNFPGVKTVLADIGSVDPGAVLRHAGIENDEVAGIIGGPPCQGYSIAGKRNPHDPRNALVGSFFRFVDVVEPSFFVLENVPGILDTASRSHLDNGLELVAARFEIVGPVVLDASDFGAATSRERVVVIGYRADRLDPVVLADVTGRMTTKASVREAIADLPAPHSAEADTSGHFWAPYPPQDPATSLSEYAKRARRPPPAEFSDETVRERLRRSIVSGFRPTVHGEAVLERFAKVQPGRRDRISKYTRLRWETTSPTLRAGTGKDRGSFQAVRPLHPSQNRVITVREAARLQGFPDWFQFHRTIWHSFRMIGNSVSPYLAEGVLRLLAERMETKSPSRAHQGRYSAKSG